MTSAEQQGPGEHLDRIERRLRYILASTCRALADLAGLAEPVAVPSLTLRHWTQFREQWTSLLPGDPTVATQVEQAVGQKYPSAEPEQRPESEAFDQFLDKTDWISLRAGEMVVRRGDASDSFYILIEGQVAAVLANSLRPVSKGALIGEVEFVTGSPYQNSVRSLRNSELIRIPRVVLDALAARDPLFWKRIATSAIHHLDELKHGKREPGGKSIAIALAPAGATAIPLSLGDGLAQTLNTICIGSQAVDAALGAGWAQLEPQDSGEGRVLDFLEAQEANRRCAIYQCDATLTPWTLRCLRRADRLLFVASPGASDRAPNEIEAHTKGWEFDLVLCQTASSDWANGRRPRLVHQFGANQADLARLGRFLTGRALGLVLGGGGSRGFAHIGALRALREAGLEVDLVGGTSMGACIGAQCALQWDWLQMREACREGFVRRKPLFDYAIPQVSLLSGRRLSGVFRSMFAERRIEDLPVNFFAISSDLVTGQCVVHRSGLVHRAVRASTSVAGIFPPVPDAGRLLVDGGILNNLPVDVMSAMAPDVRIAAVDVNPYGFHTFATCSDYGESLGSLKLVSSWLNRRRKTNYPPIHAILERATMLNGVRSAQALLPLMTLYLHPPTDDIGFFETARIDEIVELGYRFASVEIEAWHEGNG